MFICRLALAMGLPPSTIEQMPSRDLALLARYWNEEPWGTVRDNIHAAIIAREIRRPWLKDPSRNALKDFMVMTHVDVAEKRTEKTAGIFQRLKSIAVRTTRAQQKLNTARKRKRRRRARRG